MSLLIFKLVRFSSVSVIFTLPTICDKGHPTPTMSTAYLFQCQLAGIRALTSSLLGHLGMVQYLGTMVETEILPQKLQGIWDILQQDTRGNESHLPRHIYSIDIYL